MQVFRPTDTWIALNLQGDIGPLTTYITQRGRLVAYPRASPIAPPTPTQEAIRDIFRNAATAWSDLLPAQRDDWAIAAERANLSITGYNCWTWFYRSRNKQSLGAIERAANITLTLPP